MHLTSVISCASFSGCCSLSTHLCTRSLNSSVDTATFSHSTGSAVPMTTLQTILLKDESILQGRSVWLPPPMFLQGCEGWYWARLNSSTFPLRSERGICLNCICRARWMRNGWETALRYKVLGNFVCEQAVRQHNYFTPFRRACAALVEQDPSFRFRHIPKGALLLIQNGCSTSYTQIIQFHSAHWSPGEIAVHLLDLFEGSVLRCICSK